MSKPDPARLRRASTTAAIFNEAGSILLHQRSDNGLWALPGGAIETGEQADASAAREVQEETGYKVEILRLVGIYSHPDSTTITYPNGDVAAYVSLLFEGRVSSGEAKLCDESLAVDWFPPNALPEPFLASHRIRIADAVAGQEAAFYR